MQERGQGPKHPVTPKSWVGGWAGRKEQPGLSCSIYTPEMKGSEGEKLAAKLAPATQILVLRYSTA